MGIRSYSGISAYSTGENFVVYATVQAWSGGATKPPLIYCHGAGGTALLSADNVTESLLLKELAKDYVVVSGDWGGDKFGNDAAMTLMNNALSYIRTNWRASNVAPVVVGGSMGACTILNYALDNAVTSVAAVIPLTDLNKAYTQNLLGLKSTIDAAYGGTYSPSVDGARNDPNTFASLISNTVPIALFVSTNDPYIPNSTAHQFIANRPATKYKELGAAGHTADVLGAYRAQIISYINNPSGFVGDTAPPPVSSAGPNLIANPALETDITGWTNYYGTLTRDTTTAHTGIGSLSHLSLTLAGYGFYSNSMATTPGVPYRFSMWVKGTGQIKMNLFRGSALNYVNPQTITLTSTWTYYEYTYTPASGETDMVLFPIWQVANSTLYMDDIYFGTAP